MEISNYPIIQRPNGSQVIDFSAFIIDLDNSLNNIKFLSPNHNLSKEKLYFAKNLTIPKERLKKIEKKYNIKKTLDISKADVVFSDFFNKKQFLEYYLKSLIGKYYVINKFDLNTGLRTISFTNIISYEYILDLIKESKSSTYGINDDINIGVLKKRDAENIINQLSFYFKNVPVLCISDIAEDDLKIFSKLEFLKFKNRLINSDTAHFTLLNIYSTYNAVSVKAFFKNQNYFSHWKYFFNTRYLDHIKNKDVYTKYLLKYHDDKIYTANPIIKNIYYFKNRLNKNENDLNKRSLIGNTYKLKKLIKDMAAVPDNLKKDLYFLISESEVLKEMENNLINFEVLPENEKSILINKTLDLISSLISNGSIEDLKSEYDL